MRKTLLLLSTALLFALAGCGYHLGSVMHPQIKTIGVPPVVNDTNVYNLSAEMRGLLAEQFMVDGSLKVVNVKSADCLIYVKIIEVAYSEITQRSYDSDNEIFVPNEWEARVTAEFSVVLPGRRDPLLPARVVTGRANFQAPSDLETTRQRGIRQALRDAAQLMVEYTTEGW